MNEGGECASRVIREHTRMLRWHSRLLRGSGVIHIVGGLPSQSVNFWSRDGHLSVRSNIRSNLVKGFPSHFITSYVALLYTSHQIIQLYLNYSNV
jgi:hypothetical protein